MHYAACTVFLLLLLNLIAIDGYICTKEEGTGGLSFGWLAGLLAKIADCFRHNMYIYILYPRSYKGIRTSILCMDLPITTNIAGEWLNSLSLHDDNKYTYYN